ncbi:MAG: Acyl-CoA dehydrogenase family member 10 [Candidatus Woesebacteria bacterium GW2011_GWA1_44_23]|uniref:Acyl-CoA dehydrogenase family member 10 n=1 Tax=Candidatus Woesebacteria bacterium GW2011_GWA1_44_23 TaxID=1618558 RepID=A0A837I9G5_9BACT|nr:MAG: Acyl-CoA dehydrogenase family member 10 [Candidatus Woesebacteria bacterium GW2011_GWA1_44_23]
MIKTVLFDYAGVITPTKNNFIFATNNSKRFGLTPKELMQMTYENWGDTALGKQKDSDFWNQIANKLKIKPQELMNLVIETFPINKKMVDVIKKTKVNHTTVLFSNQIESWLEKVIDDNKLRNIFTYSINSYNVGSRKPEQKIFLEALKITNSKPEETLFVDDSPENIEAARQIGINTIQFDNFEQFLTEYKGYVCIS